MNTNCEKCISEYKETFMSPKGVIQSPGYPNTYERLLLCVYVISRPVGYHITLTFTDFDLEPSGQCATIDYLKVFSILTLFNTAIL